MPDEALPQWLDQAHANTVAVFTLDDGERFTADIVTVDNGWGELIVDVVSSNRPHPDSDQRRRAIPLGRVVFCQTISRAGQPWPFCDPCRNRSFSLARFLVLATLVVCMTLGSVILFDVLMEGPYGIQEASAIAYTISVVYLTFSASYWLGPYRFTCPAVRTQVSRLLWRHLGFLVSLFALQTAALAARPNLPDWWNAPSSYSRDGPPFELALGFLCVVLGCAQVFTNRSLLDRAHRDFKA